MADEVKSATLAEKVAAALRACEEAIHRLIYDVGVQAPYAYRLVDVRNAIRAYGELERRAAYEHAAIMFEEIEDAADWKYFPERLREIR